MANTFNFGAKQWATKKGSILAYNSENNNFKPLPFDFTRSSSATRVNKDGLIEVVGSNEPRVDYLNNADGHLLLEPSRTNGYRNGVLDGAVVGGSLPTNWSASTPAGLTTSVVGIGTEKGLSYVDVRFQGTLSSTTYVLTTSANTEMAASPSTAYNHSMYISLVSGSANSLLLRPVIIQRNSGGSYISEYSAEISATSTLNRQDITLDSSVALTAYIHTRLYITGTVGQSVDLTLRFAGFQLEQGSYATSYIPTSGSSVTRAGEAAVGAGNSNVFNDSQGGLYMEFEVIEKTSSSSYTVSIRSSSGSNVVGVGYRFNRAYADMYDGTNFISNNTANLIDGKNKILITYSSGNSAKLFLNGSKVLDFSGTIPSVSGLSELVQGDRFLNNKYYGNIIEINYQNTLITDSEAIALTS